MSIHNFMSYEKIVPNFECVFSFSRAQFFSPFCGNDACISRTWKPPPDTKYVREWVCVCKTHSDHSILSINQCRVHRACTQHIYIQFIRSLVRSQILNSRVEIVMYVDVNVDAIIHTHNQNHTTHFRHYIEMNFVSCVRAKDFDHWMRHCVRTLRKKGDFLSLSLFHPFSDGVHFDILSSFFQEL